MASAVFRGRVVAIESDDTFLLRVTFEVAAVWKGPAAELMEVLTTDSTASCGYPFSEGADYIVYASYFEDDLITGSCTRTRAYSQEEAAALGTPIWPGGDGLFHRGDINTDGAQNTADAICLLTYLFGPDGSPCKQWVPDCLDAADVNDDGDVSIADAVYLLGHLFSGTGALPAPFGACGIDPTDDTLGVCVYPHDRCP